MIIIYNGVKMELAQINSIQRRAIYDETGVDYLYTEWMIDVVGIVNREEGIASWLDGKTGKTLSNLSSTITDLGIRFLLMTPRRTFILKFASNKDESVNDESAYETMLACPNPGSACDVNNGPIPLVCNITEVAGEGTFAIQYVIKCHVNECTGVADGRKTDSGPICLSNRFKMIHSISDDHYTTRTIEGNAIFRADIINRINSGGQLETQLIDEYRAMFTFPVPKNFQRIGIQVEQSPDGTAIRYAVVDKELSTNLNNLGTNAVKVEMNHSQSLTTEADILNGVLSGLNSMYQFRYNRKWAQDDNKGSPKAVIIEGNKSVNNGAPTQLPDGWGIHQK